MLVLVSCFKLVTDVAKKALCTMQKTHSRPRPVYPKQILSRKYLFTADDSIDEENPFAAVRQEQDRKKLAIKNAAARANACISRKYTAICGIVVAGIPWGVAMLVDWHAVRVRKPTPMRRTHSGFIYSSSLLMQ